jgi:uncharacterized protein with FMN-binding domain
MRRIVFAVGGTLAGLAMLLSFKSHSSVGLAGIAAGAADSKPYGQASAAASGASGASGTTSGGAKPGSVTTAGGGRLVTGNVANTAYGPVQIQVTLIQNKITKVAVLEQPQSTENDIRIGDFAFPQLIKETLAAQSDKIDSVSGATYTSGGYIKSLQSVLDNGV